MTTFDDLYRLDDMVSGIGINPLDLTDQHGEHFHVAERMVVSPCAGVFEPDTATASDAAAGAPLEIGTVVGRVSGRDVCSPFAGRFMALLALPGERVRPGQPVAWLRAG